MISRTALARIGKMVAAEVAEGHPGSASQLALKSIEAVPDIASDLIELIIKEGTKKRPDDDDQLDQIGRDLWGCLDRLERELRS